MVAAGTFLVPPTYRAEAVLLVEATPPPVAPADGDFSAPPVDSTLEPGAADAVEIGVRDASSFALRRARSRLALLTTRALVRRVVDSLGPEAWPQHRGLSRDEVVERIRAGIRVEASDEDDVVHVSLRGRNPERIALTLGQLVDHFVREVASSSAWEGELRDLDAAAAALEQEIQKATEAVRAAEEGGGVLALGEEMRRRNLELRAELEALREARVALDQLEHKAGLLQASQDSGEGGEVTLSILGAEGALEDVHRLWEEARVLRSDRAALEARGSYLRSEAERIEARLDAVDAAVARRIAAEVAAFTRRLEEAGAVHEARAARYSEALSAAQAARERLDGVERLREAREDLLRRESALRERRAELVARRASEGPEVRAQVLEPAAASPRPVEPQPVRNMLVALAAGLLGGLGLALLLEGLDDSIKGGEDVRDCLALPSIGFVPLLASPNGGGHGSGGAGLVPVLDPRASASEAFRGICSGMSRGAAASRLDASVPGEQVVLVTSAVPGEGKTTTAVNLALALARAGERTLLVDANLRDPRIHRTFEVENRPGLAELVAVEGTCREFVRGTSVPGLFVLPAGKAPDPPGDLFLGRGLAGILAEARGEFDRIVLDSPSILLAADAVALGRLADTTLFVVGAFRTSREEAKAATDYLRGLGIRVAGVVLNRIPPASGVCPASAGEPEPGEREPLRG